MLLRRKKKIDAPRNFYPEVSLHVTAKTMQHPVLSTRLIPVSWQQMYSNPAVNLMPVTHSSLCPCPAWTVPSQIPNEAKGNAFHESKPTRFTPCDFGILVFSWMLRNRMDRERKVLRGNHYEKQWSIIGMSLEQSSKVKLLFWLCSHRGLHMLETPWKVYLMEEKKGIIMTWRTCASPIEC